MIKTKIEGLTDYFGVEGDEALPSVIISIWDVWSNNCREGIRRKVLDEIEEFVAKEFDKIDVVRWEGRGGLSVDYGILWEKEKRFTRSVELVMLREGDFYRDQIEQIKEIVEKINTFWEEEKKKLEGKEGK